MGKSMARESHSVPAQPATGYKDDGLSSYAAGKEGRRVKTHAGSTCTLSSVTLPDYTALHFVCPLTPVRTIPHTFDAKSAKLVRLALLATPSNVMFMHNRAQTHTLYSLE